MSFTHLVTAGDGSRTARGSAAGAPGCPMSSAAAAPALRAPDTWDSRRPPGTGASWKAAPGSASARQRCWEKSKGDAGLGWKPPLRGLEGL